MDKLCETCNSRNTKKKNGKFCQICLSARNNAKLKGSGYYKDYYQNNKDKFVKPYNKKGLRPDTELTPEQLYQRQYYLKHKNSTKN